MGDLVDNVEVVKQGIDEILDTLIDNSNVVDKVTHRELKLPSSCKVVTFFFWVLSTTPGAQTFSLCCCVDITVTRT